MNLVSHWYILTSDSCHVIHLEFSLANMETAFPCMDISSLGGTLSFLQINLFIIGRVSSMVFLNFEAHSQTWCPRDILMNCEI